MAQRTRYEFVKHRFEISWFYDGKDKLFRFIFLVFAGALCGLAGQSTLAVTCPANTSPVSSCADLVISGSNLTVDVISGVTITQTNPNPSISNSSVTGTNLSISGDIFSNAHGLINTNVINSLVINASGTLYGYEAGIRNVGTITSLVNKNILTGATDNNGWAIENFGTIGTFTNTGTVTGHLFNIYNGEDAPPGAFGTINNLQGHSAPLRYSGDLPRNYNIIIYSTSNYGKLSAFSIGGVSMAFGIYGGGVSGVAASTITAYRYQGVLETTNAPSFSGFLTGLTGTYGAYSYSLVLQDGSLDIWDLVVTLTPVTPTDSSTTPTGSSTTPTPATPPVPTSMSAGGTTSLASVGTTTTPVFTGGTLTDRKSVV